MAKTSHHKHTPFLLLLLLLLHLLTECLATDELTINTGDGTIRGKLLPATGGLVRAFLGIPYAKPPIGILRFRKPEPTEGWEGVRNAMTFPNSCYQMRDTVFPDFSGAEMWNPNTPMNEDCLYLNVWSPRLNHTQASPQAPVLVWIYGGGFTSGTSSLDLYDGRFLSQHEGAVVVSMNYRLGALGFISLPGSKDIHGNAGLLDQQLALHWVANNIAAFGGDPAKVTLFGESAGAASVGFHLLSPGSKNLFQRAVLQSGSPNAPWATMSQQLAWDRAMALGKLLHCPLSPGDLEVCLQRAEPVDIANKQYEIPVKEPSIISLPFSPIVDGTFLLDEPEVLLNTGNFLKTEVIFGLNQDEGTYFLLYGMPGYNLTNQSLITRTEFMQGIPRAVAGASNVTREAVIFQYTDWTDEENRGKNRDAMGRLVGDQFFFCPVLEFARRYSQHGGKTFLYLFDHRSSTNPWPAWMGVMHGYEIEFIFGMPLNDKLRYTQEEANMSRKLMKHWANFARTGNPSIGSTEWPMFTPEHQNYVTLNAQPPKESTMMRANQCRFWRNLIPKIQSVSDNLQLCEHAVGAALCCNYVFLLLLLVFTLTY